MSGMWWLAAAVGVALAGSAVLALALARSLGDSDHRARAFFANYEHPHEKYLDTPVDLRLLQGNEARSFN